MGSPTLIIPSTILMLLLAGDNVAGIRTRFNSTCLTDMLRMFGIPAGIAASYEMKLAANRADIDLLMSTPRHAATMLGHFGIADDSDREKLIVCLATGCGATPCAHGGRCVFSERAFDKYICDCRPGYQGHSCQFDVCSSNPCKNRGACYHDSGGFECRCRPGFAGPMCEIDNNECISSPCVNGGTCVDGANRYQCKCPPEFTGKRCHKRTLTLEDFRELQNTVKEIERNLETVSGGQDAPNLGVGVGVGLVPLQTSQAVSSSAESQPCQGIVGWRYVPWSSWRSGEDRGLLRLENYMKKRDDTYLKITFNSVLMQNAHDQCAQWSVQIDARNCSEPAPIQTVIHTFHSQEHNNNAERRPAQVMGMCRASERGPLLRGSHAISVHVNTCPGYDSADASTGWGPGLTSFLMVEEYCPPN